MWAKRENVDNTFQGRTFTNTHVLIEIGSCFIRLKRGQLEGKQLEEVLFSQGRWTCIRVRGSEDMGSGGPRAKSCIGRLCPSLGPVMFNRSL
jgi:hypothetical protein